MGEALGTFGKYFLTERLATGGMAEIYLAKLIGPSGFEKQLVIKQIHPELAGDERFVDLLIAEAKTLVALSHGNIVPVYELGVVDGTYFIAMEYVDGPTLEELSRRLRERDEALPVEVAAYVAAELARGLDHAHRKGEGLVHRDLSPRNVMLSREGEVKLLDFGIALPMSEGGARSGAQPAGSVPYMSPEQARCESLDARSDLFSAGVLLWELLTGEPLFARENVASTLAAVLEGPVPAPSAIRKGVPAELDRLCARALERDRDERVQSAAQWLLDLQRYLYSVDDPVGPAQISRLVARACPPVVRGGRRSATATDHTLPGDGATPRLATAARGDHTRPMARGKARRAETVQTFATRADFAAVLGDDGDAAASSAPPKRVRWAALAAGAAAAAVLVAVALPRSADRGDAAAAETVARAPDHDPDAAAPGASAAAPDAAPAIGIDESDAAPARTAAAEPERPERPERRRAAPRERARPGTLRVGADPWGDVYVDGARIGRAPGAWPVAAGTHRIEVRLGEKRRRFTVEIAPGEVESLGVVDFSP